MHAIYTFNQIFERVTTYKLYKTRFKLKKSLAMLNAVLNGTNVIMIHAMLTRPTLPSPLGPIGNMKPVRKNVALSPLKAN